MDNVRVGVKRPLVAYVCVRACLKMHCTCVGTSRNFLYMPSVVVAPMDLFYLLPVLLMTSFPPQRVTLRVARACATSTRVPRSSKYSSDERRHVPRSTLPSYTMAANCAPGAKSARVYSALFVLNDVPNSENVHFLLPARRPGTHYPLTFEKSQILILFI